ncbi:MAG: agmatinase [Pseudomonadota bacterium]
MALEDAAYEVDTAITRKGKKGLSYESPFSGVPSFLRRTLTKDLRDVDVAVTGIPFDSAVTNRPGARLGPRAIREASTLQAPDAPYGWDVDPMTEFNVIDYGDMAYDYAHIDLFPARLRDHITDILDAGATSLCLGGDHYITYPILQAYADKSGPLALLQFDAHSDTWPDEDRSRIDHGTGFYKAIKDGIILPERTVQLGIRTDNPDPLGVHTIDAPLVHTQSISDTAAQIKNTIGDHAVYVTFDIDCLDPAYAPGTGTPVSGGLSSAQAIAIIRGLAGLNVLGMDVVEVSPPFDPTGATSIAGAHIATELLCLWAHRKKFS